VSDNIPKRVGARREVSTEAVIEPRPAVSDKRAARQSNDAPQLSKNVDDARRKMFSEAREHVSLLSPASAINTVRALPLALQEVYLLAEEDGMCRRAVLDYFPRPGATGRQRFGKFMRTHQAA
jgi:hypothetical protein